MKNRFLIPVMAMFLAVGMSFAIENRESDPTTDYVRSNGSFVSLGMEYDCGIGQHPCQIQLRNGQIKDLYDAESLGSQKEGDGTIVKQ